MSDGETEHPATVRFDPLNGDGPVRPFSVAEQWKQAEDWYRFLQGDKSSDYPVLGALNVAWGELEPLYVVAGNSVLDRGGKLKSTSSSPLSTLFYMVDMGFYPPPELLLVLLDCWDAYKEAGGALTLDEAFLDGSRKGAGNYAKRKASRFRAMYLRFEFDSMLRKGLSRAEAAESLSAQLGGKPDADSILRMLRGFQGPMVKHDCTAGEAEDEAEK